MEGIFNRARDGRKFDVVPQKDIHGRTYFEAWKALPKGSNGCLGDWLFLGQFQSEQQAWYHIKLKYGRKALQEVGYPYGGRNADGSFNIHTTDESLYWNYVAGLTTLEQAARDFCSSGWTNYVDVQYTENVFKRIDKKYNKLAIC